MRKFKFLFSMIMSLIILCSCEGVQFNIGTQGEHRIIKDIIIENKNLNFLIQITFSHILS